MENRILATPMSASDQTGGIAAKKAGLALGYFSIALGLIEVAAPGRLARWLGVDNDTARRTIFVFGLRELAAGGALLRGPAVSTNVWNRVIGDLIDAGALALAARSATRNPAPAPAKRSAPAERSSDHNAAPAEHAQSSQRALTERAPSPKIALALAGGVVAGAFVADLLTAKALDRLTGRTFPRLKRPHDPVNGPVFTPEPHHLTAA